MNFGPGKIVIFHKHLIVKFKIRFSNVEEKAIFAPLLTALLGLAGWTFHEFQRPARPFKHPETHCHHYGWKWAVSQTARNVCQNFWSPKCNQSGTDHRRLCRAWCSISYVVCIFNKKTGPGQKKR